MHGRLWIKGLALSGETSINSLFVEQINHQAEENDSINFSYNHPKYRNNSQHNEALYLRLRNFTST